MDLLKAIQEAVETANDLTIIRADQTGDLPQLPYATYKVISDRKGVGRETIEFVDLPNQLDEQVERERNVTLSFNIYGNTHDEAYELAKKLRRWFENNRSAEFCEENNITFASVTDVTNRTTFLVDSYDEKYGFDIIVRYNDVDQYEIDYFDTVEYEIIIDRE